MLFDRAVNFFSAVYCHGPDEHGSAFHWLQRNRGQRKCKIFGMAEKSIVTVSSATQESLKPTRHRSGSESGQKEFYGEVAGALSDRQVAGVSSLVARWTSRRHRWRHRYTQVLCQWHFGSGVPFVFEFWRADRWWTCGRHGRTSTIGSIYFSVEGQYNWTRCDDASASDAARKLLEGAWWSEAGEAIKGHSLCFGMPKPSLADSADVP